MNAHLSSFEPHFSRIVILSLIVHAVMFSIIYYFSKTPERFFITPVYTVDLVSMSDIDKGQKKAVKAKENRKSPSKPPSTAKKGDASQKQAKKIEDIVKKQVPEKKHVKEPIRQEEKPKSIIEERKPSKIASLVDALDKNMKEQEKSLRKTFEIPKETSKPVEEKGAIKREDNIKAAFNKVKESDIERVEDIKREVSKEKELDIPSYQPIEWNVELKREKGTIAVGSQRGKLDNRLLDVAFKAYYNMISDRIHSSWILPEGIREKSIKSAIIVSIAIKKDGEILRIKTERASGNSLYDGSAIRAIEKANPLPPLPKEYSGDVLEVGFRFCPPWWDNCE